MTICIYFEDTKFSQSVKVFFQNFSIIKFHYIYSQDIYHILLWVCMMIYGFPCVLFIDFNILQWPLFGLHIMLLFINIDQSV